ncbi:MAG: DUF2336 domain-containing protein [Pseudomonadota bacterium]|nr:DUF2336 domain-containing protein [Pseudomonadota bacterium]
MTTAISETEIRRLIGSMTEDHKGAVADQVGRLVSRSGLSPAEMRIALQLIDRLMADAVVAVRAALAEHIAESPLLPRRMIERLIADVDQVALPIVRLSPIMDDALLLEQIDRSEAHQMAVADRETVSAVVAERMVTVGSEKAVGALVRNTGAELQQAALGKAVDRFQDSTLVMGAVAARPGLPLAVAEQLVTLTVSEQCIQNVAELMMRTLMARQDLPTILAEDLFVHARERAIANVARHSDSAFQVQELARRMNDKHRLTTTLMLRVLAGGDQQFFIAGMEALTGWPHERVVGAINGAGVEGFRRLYAESNLDPMLFHAFRVARDEMREANRRKGKFDQTHFIARVVGRISEEYRNISPTGLEDVLSRLRRRAGVT